MNGYSIQRWPSARAHRIEEPRNEILRIELSGRRDEFAQLHAPRFPLESRLRVKPAVSRIQPRSVSRRSRRGTRFHPRPPDRKRRADLAVPTVTRPPSRPRCRVSPGPSRSASRSSRNSWTCADGDPDRPPCNLTIRPPSTHSRPSSPHVDEGLKHTLRRHSTKRKNGENQMLLPNCPFAGCESRT